MTETRKDQNVFINPSPIPGRPVIVFDVNETVLNLDALRATFEPIFNDRAAKRLRFAGPITYSSHSRWPASTFRSPTSAARCSGCSPPPEASPPAPPCSPTNGRADGSP